VSWQRPRRCAKSSVPQASEQELGYSSWTAASSTMMGKRWCWPMWQASWKATEGETVFESASEDVSATCAVEALRWMGRDSEECHQELGEQAAAVGHGVRWPMPASKERLVPPGENRYYSRCQLF
jgi:hypothetical protein